MERDQRVGLPGPLADRWAATSLFWVVSNFRPFLAFTGRTDLVEAVGLAMVKRSHRILPVLDDEDTPAWCARLHHRDGDERTPRSRCWR